MPINILKTKADLERVFVEFNVQLYRFVLVRCAMQKEIAEELTQDVFIQAWEKRNLYDSTKSSLKNWLYVIARNKVIDYLRKEKHTVALEDLKDEIGDKRDDNIEIELMMEGVIANIKKLDDADQEIIILRYLQELEIGEIKYILGKQYSATKVMIHRAMQKLIKLCNE